MIFLTKVKSFTRFCATDHPRSLIVVAALAVAVAAIWVHWPCVYGGFLTDMDDDVYMAAAEAYGGLTLAGVRWAFMETWEYYQPLPRLTHLLAYSIWGLRPWGHHAVNLGLHACNAGLVTVLAWRLLTLGASGLKSFSHSNNANDRKDLLVRAAAATFVGVMFAVHPLQTESVAWISGRTQLLCAVLMLGCVLAYLQAVETNHTRWWFAVGLLYVLAWASKPMVVTLPFVLLVLDWFPLRRHVVLGWRALILEKLWMFAVAVVLTLLTYHFASQSGFMHDLKTLGLAPRAFLAGRAIVFYLWKLLWPAWLSPLYPSPRRVSLEAPEFLIPALVLAAICAGAWLLRRRLPSLAAAWAAFLALLLPMSSLTQFAAPAVANRHMYVAMLPLLLIIAGTGEWLWQRAPKAGHLALITVAAVAVIGLSKQSRADVRMWHDDETLWHSTLKWYPKVAAVNKRVVNAAIARRDFAAALPYAQRALEAQPENEEIRGMLGLVYLKTRSYEAAVRTLEPLLRADVWKPAARYNLACAYARLGSNDAAIAVLREVLLREPGFVEPAQRDGELAALRNHPDYAARFAALVDATKN